MWSKVFELSNMAWAKCSPGLCLEHGVEFEDVPAAVSRRTLAGLEFEDAIHGIDNLIATDNDK